MAKLIDLTGATVTVPSGWSASKGYGSFKIQCYVSDRYYTSLNIGYIYNPGYGSSTNLNKVSFVNTSTDDFTTYYYSSSFTFSITGGTDVANQTLIQWLQDNNATIEGGVWESEHKTIIKTPICLVQNKVKKVVVDNVNMTIDIYTKEIPEEE